MINYDGLNSVAFGESAGQSEQHFAESDERSLVHLVMLFVALHRLRKQLVLRL